MRQKIQQLQVENKQVQSLESLQAEIVTLVSVRCASEGVERNDFAFGERTQEVRNERLD